MNNLEKNKDFFTREEVEQILKNIARVNPFKNIELICLEYPKKCDRNEPSEQCDGCPFFAWKWKNVNS